MRVWLIATGEPVPTDAVNPRLHRKGMLAKALASRGHEVVWWTSTVNHQEKRHRFLRDTVVQVSEQYHLRFLHAPVYKTSISLRRILSHRCVARKFRQFAPAEPPPDLIVCSMPTIELSVAATQYALARGVPLVLDIEDMWPDVIVDLAPPWTRSVARITLSSMYRGMRYASRNATAISGLTPAYVDWALRFANRPRCTLDKDFPMAYETEQPNQDALTSARQFWQCRGINGTDDNFVACFAGTMGRFFEIQTVIEAARRLQSAGRSVRFVLCGAGDNVQKYRQMAEDMDNVVFPGWVEAPEIWTLMRMSSVGLAPYLSIPNFTNNLTNKPIEYFSAGLPVVSSLKGILSNLLERYQCGVTYENERADQLAEILAALDDDRERLAKLSKNAKELYMSQFTVEKVFSEMIAHLEGVTVHGDRHKTIQPRRSGKGLREMQGEEDERLRGRKASVKVIGCR